MISEFQQLLHKIRLLLGLINVVFLGVYSDKSTQRTIRQSLR